jgi:hypothetical protein
VAGISGIKTVADTSLLGVGCRLVGIGLGEMSELLHAPAAPANITKNKTISCLWSQQLKGFTAKGLFI